jgi:predicted Fe-Mo cluster-binding NifX family protein
VSNNFFIVHTNALSVIDMRICIASENNGGLDDLVSSAFGRCPAFTVVDIEDGEIKDVRVVPNHGASASGGAGVQAAQTVIDTGCSAIISSSIGPNSGEVFRMAGVRMLSAPGMRIRDAVDKFLHNELPCSCCQGTQ